jgi:hypothetical protein
VGVLGCDAGQGLEGWAWQLGEGTAVRNKFPGNQKENTAASMSTDTVISARMIVELTLNQCQWGWMAPSKGIQPSDDVILKGKENVYGSEQEGSHRLRNLLHLLRLL